MADQREHLARASDTAQARGKAPAPLVELAVGEDLPGLTVDQRGPVRPAMDKHVLAQRQVGDGNFRGEVIGGRAAQSSATMAPWSTWQVEPVRGNAVAVAAMS